MWIWQHGGHPNDSSYFEVKYTHFLKLLLSLLLVLVVVMIVSVIGWGKQELIPLMLLKMIFFKISEGIVAR